MLPKLIIENDEDLPQGIIDAVDIDSYRPSKHSTDKISLADETGFLLHNQR
ncbi:MAG: hypothetical protein LAC70_08645 [Methylovulum sp.]|nr:hypothetical protein [Methylovulum sp.]